MHLRVWGGWTEEGTVLGLWKKIKMAGLVLWRTCLGKWLEEMALDSDTISGWRGGCLKVCYPRIYAIAQSKDMLVEEAYVRENDRCT